MHREREMLRGRTDALQMTLMQSQGQQGGLGRDYTPDAILKKVHSCELCLLAVAAVCPLQYGLPGYVVHWLGTAHTRPPPAKLGCTRQFMLPRLPRLIPACLILYNLQQLEDLDTLKSCLGWQLESAAEDVVSSKVRCKSRRCVPHAVLPLAALSSLGSCVIPRQPSMPCRWCCAWRTCSVCAWTLAAAWRPPQPLRCCQVCKPGCQACYLCAAMGWDPVDDRCGTLHGS